MIRSKNEMYQKALHLIVPIALQQLLLAAVSAGDSMMLGFVSGDAMAAVSLAANIEFVENLFLSAVVGGAMILTAQYWGKGDRNTIERIFGLILKYVVPISAIFTAFALVVPEKLMGLFTDEGTLIALGAEYIRMAAGSYLLTGVTQCYLCILKTTGQTKQSVLISSAALCLDTILNALFIFGFHMGAAGAALTTSITRFVELVTVLTYARNNMTVKPNLRTRVSGALHRDFLHCSIPHLINWGLGTTVYAAIIGHLGTAITTAYSAGAIVRNLSISLCKGLAQGVEILLADMLGAGKMQGCKSVWKKDEPFFPDMRRNLRYPGADIWWDPVLVYESDGRGQAGSELDDPDKRLLCRYPVHQYRGGVRHLCHRGRYRIRRIQRCSSHVDHRAPSGTCAAFWWKLPPLSVYAILSLDEVVKIPWIYAHYTKYKWLRNITREETL